MYVSIAELIFFNIYDKRRFFLNLFLKASEQKDFVENL